MLRESFQDERGSSLVTAMSKKQRIQAALQGKSMDRLPFMFWHHFRPHGSPQRMAELTLEFFGGFDLDIYKVMPDIPYPSPRDAVRSADDWLMFSRLDALEGNLGRMVRVAELLRTSLTDDCPIIVTMFNPLCYAMNAANRSNFREHLERDGVRVHEALAVIAENLAEWAAMLIAHGADGIFFASQGAGDNLMTREQYLEFGRPYDLQVLRGAEEGWLNVLHIHGYDNLMIDLFYDYPAPVFSWSDRLSKKSLRSVREHAPDKCLMGGIDEKGAITRGDRSALQQEMEDTLVQTDGGQRLILANGCSVADDINVEHLKMARELALSMKPRF